MRKVSLHVPVHPSGYCLFYMKVNENSRTALTCYALYLFFFFTASSLLEFVCFFVRLFGYCTKVDSLTPPMVVVFVCFFVCFKCLFRNCLSFLCMPLMRQNSKRKSIQYGVPTRENEHADILQPKRIVKRLLRPSLDRRPQKHTSLDR